LPPVVDRWGRTALENKEGVVAEMCAGTEIWGNECADCAGTDVWGKECADCAGTDIWGKECADCAGTEIWGLGYGAEVG
jgi:hypothetical protein